MKKLGLIGGMGPEATCYYYGEVIKHTKADRDQEHIDMIILNHSTIPDRTEAIKSGDVEGIIKILTEDAKFLENGGCSFIAMAPYVMFAVQQNQMIIASFLLGIMGALIGYLRYNLHPAKIFMGDAGSLALGGVLAAVAMVLKMELLVFLRNLATKI